MHSTATLTLTQLSCARVQVRLTGCIVPRGTITLYNEFSNIKQEV